MSICKGCEKTVEIGQTIVGLPVIRITASAKSVMAGTEILFHVPCFLRVFKVIKAELVNHS